MFKYTPIAHVKTDFKQKFGIPRQSGRVNALGEIVFTPEFNNPDYIRRINEFNYLWLVFDFSLSHKQTPSATVRPPRLGGNERVGVFATRSPFRPNPIGLSCVKLERIQNTDNGKTLIVSGVDLLDGTPIIDIKPYIPSTDCHVDAIGGYADQFTNYKLKVDFPDHLLELVAPDKREVLIDVLSEDPRPSYQNDDRSYGLSFDVYNITFTVKNDTVTVLKVEIEK
ncbi:MAG: tRNA (N6-threonylcarbamoyladenosine(37)-N6)-methyltransferase TrmO [Clostridia bacterium]|nr:tRNA (N6-threonylcarbamoyladenosine(37)-N6)-methyltransferase TrmO [Clostridia bacterium]